MSWTLAAAGTPLTSLYELMIEPGFACWMMLANCAV